LRTSTHWLHKLAIAAGWDDDLDRYPASIGDVLVLNSGDAAPRQQLSKMIANLNCQNHEAMLADYQGPW